MNKKAKKKKILFVKQFSANAMFVLNDIKILEEKYDVAVYNAHTRKTLAIVFTLLKQFAYLIFNSYRFKAAYIWFADYHSFLPVLIFKLLGKKSVICAGGYEATYIPEINCGIFTNETFSKTVRRFAVAYSLRNCDYILPVDESLILNENTFLYSDIPGKQPLKDGIKYFLPDIKTKIRTVYPGYDPLYFRKKEEIKKENIVMSVGLAPNEYEIKRKGFDLLLEAAESMTTTRFVLIGLSRELIDKYKKLNLLNLELYSIVSYKELIEHYSRAKVFAQISMFEGLPSTICEAMLCECIPVGSNVNGIPGIINGNGYLIKKKMIDDVTTAFKQALNAPLDIGKKARESIIDNFSLAKRKEEILSIVSELIEY